MYIYMYIYISWGFYECAVRDAPIACLNMGSTPNTTTPPVHHCPDSNGHFRAKKFRAPAGETSLRS